MKADLIAKYQRQAASREQQLKSDAKRANAMSALTRRKEQVIVSSFKPIKVAALDGNAGTSRAAFKRPIEDSRKRKCEFAVLLSSSTIFDATKDRYMYEKVSERSESKFGFLDIVQFD